MRPPFRWMLACTGLLGAAALSLTATPKGLGGHLALYGVCAVLVLGSLGLVGGVRARWAYWALAVLVLSAYLWYVLAEFLEWRAGEPFGLGTPDSEPNLCNALKGFAAYGIPSIAFLVVCGSDAPAGAPADRAR